jgi:DNA-damage-inducible protein J
MTEVIMAQNTTISLRIDGQLKTEAEDVLRQLGLSTSEAIKIFLSAVRLKKGLPFPVQLEKEHALPVKSTFSSQRDSLLSLRGKYTKMSSSEDFALRKQEEIDIEDNRVLR